MIKAKEERKEYTLQELSNLTSTEFVGDGTILIAGVEDLRLATPSDLSFLENPKYTQQMKSSLAGAIIVHPSTARIEGKNYLLSKTPSLTFQTILELFIPPIDSGFKNIHSTAVIHPEAIIEKNVAIGPCAVIDRKVVIGANTVIGANVFIGANCSIGSNCFFHPNVTIREGCKVGNRVIIQPGAVIGSCGYGYFTDDKGIHHPLKQRGIVILEDDVEIGANTTIDRARFGATRIGKGTKIDNLVQIGHKVEIGESNLIISQSGIAGSSKTGRNVVMAGQVGIIGHIEITDGVILAARTAAIKSITEKGVYSGAPATPITEFNEQMVYIRNIKKLAKRIEALEKKLQEANLN